MDDRSQPAAVPSGERQPQRESQLPLWPAERVARGTESPESSEAAPDAVLSGPPAPPISSEPAEPSAALPAAVPWTLADLARFVLFAGAATILLMTIVATGYALLRQAFGWTARPEAALGQVPVMLSIQVAAEGLCVLFIYFTITRKYRRDFWEAIRWVRRRDQEPSFFVAGVGLAVALQLVSNLFPPEQRLPVEDWFSSTAAAYLVAVVGICVAPFVEELVFRGFFYPVFERCWGLRAAVLLTAILFAVIHGAQLAWSWKEVSAIFVVGLLLSYARGRTGSLVPSYLMHLAYNASLFVSLFLTTDQFRNLQG
ncbi:MAG: CPBP family intramembrane metalloprotease [Acidobacteria bacterium]|nr:CPBP family intramembrane metalloprotease [Acidobacteriota bacterium]